MEKLTKAQMKLIIGGDEHLGEGGGGFTFCVSTGTACSYYEAGTGNVSGSCETNSQNRCVCKGPNSSIVSDQCSAT